MSEADPRPYLPPPGVCWPDDGLSHRVELVVEVPSGPGVEIIAAELLLDVVQGFTAQGLTPASVALQIASQPRPDR